MVPGLIGEITTCKEAEVLKALLLVPLQKVVAYLLVVILLMSVQRSKSKDKLASNRHYIIGEWAN